MESTPTNARTLNERSEPGKMRQRNLSYGIRIIG